MLKNGFIDIEEYDIVLKLDIIKGIELTTRDDLYSGEETTYCVSIHKETDTINIYFKTKEKAKNTYNQIKEILISKLNEED